MSFIAIAGAKGSGKDTFGNVFVASGYKKVNIADKLKDICARTFNIPFFLFWADLSLKEGPLPCPIILTSLHIDKINATLQETHEIEIPHDIKGTKIESIRQMLDVIGMQIRSVEEDYLADIARLKMIGENRVVCCDVRFPNEMDFMRSMAEEKGLPFVSFFIQRDQTPLPDGGNNQIDSKTVDIIVMNNGSLDSLYDFGRLLIPAVQHLKINRAAAPVKEVPLPSRSLEPSLAV